MGEKNPASTSVEDLYAAASSHGGATKFPKTDQGLGSSEDPFSNWGWGREWLMYLHPELKVQRPPPPASEEERLDSLFRDLFRRRLSIEKGEIVKTPEYIQELLNVFDEESRQLLSKEKEDSTVINALKKALVETGIKIPVFDELLRDEPKSAEDKSVDERKSADEPKSADELIITQESYEDHLVKKYGEDGNSQPEFDPNGPVDAIGGRPKTDVVYEFGEVVQPRSLLPQSSRRSSHPLPAPPPDVTSAINDPSVVTSLAQNKVFVQALMQNSSFRSMMKETMMEILSES